MSRPNAEQLLTLWLEGRLSASERACFDELMNSDHNFAEKVAISSQMQRAVDCYEAQPVPNWKRSVTLNESPSRSNQYWRWFTALSFAMSCCTLLLLLTGTVGVWKQGGNLDQSQFVNANQVLDKQFIEQKFAELELEQSRVLLQLLNDMQEKQQRANAQLVDYVLTASRGERQQDFSQWINAINQQRMEDQYFYNQQLLRLNDAVDKQLHLRNQQAIYTVQ